MIILVFPKSLLELLLRDKCVVCCVVVTRKKTDDAFQGMFLFPECCSRSHAPHLPEPTFRRNRETTNAGFAVFFVKQIWFSLFVFKPCRNENHETCFHCFRKVHASRCRLRSKIKVILLRKGYSIQTSKDDIAKHPCLRYWNQFHQGRPCWKSDAQFQNPLPCRELSKHILWCDQKKLYTNRL